MFRREVMKSLLVLVTALVLGLGQAAPARADDISASVDVSGLNLRAGPGFGYSVLDVLSHGQALSLLGRSRNAVWVEVRLPDGSGGWVYSRYVRTTAQIASLPVTEASGGPSDPAGPAPQYSLYMTIESNQAVVNLQRFPASSEVVVSLSLPDGSASLTVAQGRTDAGGAAQFSFKMPARWSDGREVNQSRLILTAATAGGSFSRTASIQYFK